MKDYNRWRSASKSYYRTKSKVNRIRTLQMTDVKMVDESGEDEFVADYQLFDYWTDSVEKGFSDELNANPEEIINLRSLRSKSERIDGTQNHDYGEVLYMRISSITDLIYQKVLRTKQIEDNQGKTLLPKVLDANYFDMLNYAVFIL